MINITTLIDVQINTYMKVSMLSLLTYNYVLTFAQEVEYIWNSRWGLVKVLYLYSRYSPFIDTISAIVEQLAPNMSDATCYHLMSFNTIFAGAGIGLYLTPSNIQHVPKFSKGSRNTCYLLDFVIVNVLTAFKWTDSYVEVVVPRFGCILTRESKSGIINYIFFVVGETVVVVLTSWQGFWNFYNYGFTSEALEKVTVAFYRDGVLYYLAILPISLGTLLVLAYAPPELQILETPFRVLHSILCCKLIIHIREVARPDSRYDDAESLEEIIYTNPSTSMVQ
ncbi:hypothetical protein GYMLUDRAFT_239196 [Collybiopsis luxurians FD-317 M1]|nr:hypothetical protein GYMLUDRAFT_239196 [Collybiopsis luxurians FD-317 M1]